MDCVILVILVFNLCVWGHLGLRVGARVTSLCVLKNTNQNNICASNVFKAKTKEKKGRTFFLRIFISKLKNALFWGSTNMFQKILFSFTVAFKITDTQIVY